MNISAQTVLTSVRVFNTQQTQVTIASTQPIINLEGQSNKLPSTEVDAILVALDGNGLNNGNVGLESQTPSSPPTGTGRAARTSLLGKGWTVTVDEIAWAPATETVTWIDTNGTFTNDLATFLANADFDTVSSMVFGATGLLTSLTGLQALPALATLDCNTNALTSLDLSNCTALTTLNCSSNAALTTLTLTGCTALVTLDCHVCAITSLASIASCVSLVDINCESNQIADLDLHNNTSLVNVDCHNNILGSAPLSGLNVTGLTLMKVLSASTGSLSSIDVSTCASLENLNVSDNNLIGLDVSSCPNILGVECGINDIGNGGVLNISGCSLIETFNCYDNPNLVTLDLSVSSNMTNTQAYNCGLTSLKIGNSTGYSFLDFSNNAIPDTPNGVNECLVNLATFCLTNEGTIDISGGTNSAPTGAGLVAKAALLNPPPWVVTTN